MKAEFNVTSETNRIKPAILFKAENEEEKAVLERLRDIIAEETHLPYYHDPVIFIVG